MDNVVLIETAWGERDIAIQIDRTEQMITAAHELSDYIAGLPLTVDQNNALVSMMIKQVQEAERGALYRASSGGWNTKRPLPANESGPRGEMETR